MAGGNGSNQLGIRASQISQSAALGPLGINLQIGYCVGGSSLHVLPFMGTSGADYAIYLATIT